MKRLNLDICLRKFQTLVFIFLLLSPNSLFAVMLPLSTEELANASDVIIRGQVDRMQGKWATDKSAIVTHVEVSVHDVLQGKLNDEIIEVKEIIKGEYYKDVVTVEVEGGKVDEIEFGISDAPTFRQGEEVLLFLKLEKSRVEGNIYKLVGFSQGKYGVDENGKAHKEGFALFIQSEEDKEKVDNNLHIDKLIEKIDPKNHAFVHVDRSKRRNTK